MGFNRFGLGFGRRSGSGLPGFATTSAPVMSRSGATVNYTAGVYSPVPTGVLTTFYIDDVAQAPGSVTFPYTLTAGSRMYATELPSSVGYVGSLVTSNFVLNPSAIDIPNAEWNATEAALDADTRKTLVTVARDNRAGFKIHVLRGEGSGGLAYLSTANPDQTYLGAGSEMISAGASLLTWQSTGQATRGATGRARLVEVETAVGVTSARWCSEIDSFPVSNVPNAPTGVVISTGAGAGLIYVDVANAGTVPASDVARPITAMYATIDGGAPFALTPSGGDAGRRIITALGAVPVSVQVYWANANGAGAATAAVSVTPGVEVTLIPTTLQPSVTYNGATYTFSRPVPVGQFVLGQPFILSTGAAYTITSITPDSVGGAYGAMIDPFFTTYPAPNGPQGFDIFIDDASITADAAKRSAYVPALNIDPVNSGSPIPVNPGEIKTIVKSLRRAGAVAGTNNILSDYSPLTVLAEAPPVGSYRPAYSSLTKTFFGNDAAIDLSCFRNLTLPAGFPTVAVAVENYRDNMALFGARGESLRRMQTLGATEHPDYAGLGGQNYISNQAQYLSDIFWHLHSNATTTDKLTLFRMLYQSAVDIDGECERGHFDKYGAGQHAFFGALMYIVAQGTKSAHLMDRANNLLSNDFDQVIWSTDATRIGAGKEFPGSASVGGRYNQTMFAEQLNEAGWRDEAKAPFEGYDTSRFITRYESTSGRARMACALPVCLLLPSGGFPSGEIAILKGGPNDKTNRRTSVLGHMDIERTITPQGTSNRITPRAYAAYDAFRDLLATPRYTQRPSQIYMDWTHLSFEDVAGPGRWTAITGGVAWDFSALNFSTLPKTGVRVARSHDNVQFNVVSGVSQSDSRTDYPRGVTSYNKIAFQNALGWGDYSPTFPLQAGARNRGQITPLGAASGTPTVIDSPQIMVPIYPGFAGSEYMPAPAALGHANVTLTAGCGWWSGDLTGGFTYKWQVADAEFGTYTDIPGATAKTYSRTATDWTKWFKFVITNGATSFTTTAVQAPAAPAIDPNVVIDTTFDGNFPLVYGSVASGLAGWSLACTPTHSPAAVARPDTSAGLVKGVKTGARPTLTFEMAGLTIGQTYTIDADCPCQWDVAWLASGALRLSTVATGGTFTTLATLARNMTPDIEASTAYTAETIKLRGLTFVASAATMYLRFIVDTATGSVNGGNPTLSYLKVARVV